jgi:hypothetical protein
VGRSGSWFGTSVFANRAKSDIKSNTYSDIFDTLVEYLISDGYSLYCIRIRYPKQVSESISVIRKKTFEYPKKISKSLFALFGHGYRRILSVPFTSLLVSSEAVLHYSKRKNFRRPKPSDISFAPSEIGYVRRH